MADEKRPVWKHRKGDRYVPVFGDWWLPLGGELRHEWSLLGGYQGTVAEAKRIGFREQGSDDFNIAVVRGGSVVANLWMHEVVDTDAEVLDGIAAVMGLRSHASASGSHPDDGRMESPAREELARTYGNPSASGRTEGEQ